MKIEMTQFEAAVCIKLQENAEIAGTKHIVVLDVDSMQAGMCEMNEETPRLIFNTERIPEGRELIRHALGSDRYPVEKIWKEQLSEINVKMERYYRSNQVMNDRAVYLPEQQKELSCAELKELFLPVKQQLEPVLGRVSEMLEQKNIDESNIKILLIGKYAGYVLFLYTVKEYFSFDPFMEDTRFSPGILAMDEAELKNRVKPEQAERERKKETTETTVNTVSGHEVSILFYHYNEESKQIEAEEVPLMKRKTGQETEDFGLQPEFVYLSLGEKLTVFCDGIEKKVEIPCDITNGFGEMIEVRADADSMGVKLQIKPMHMPEKYYEIKL